MMNFLYGGRSSVSVQEAPSGARFIQLSLAPHQFVILQ